VKPASNGPASGPQLTSVTHCTQWVVAVLQTPSAHVLAEQSTTLPQLSTTLPEHWTPQAVAMGSDVQHVVPAYPASTGLHDVLQQSPQSSAVLTLSPSGTQATHCPVVSLQVPVVHRLAVQVTGLPQLSITVPEHCVPHAAATLSDVQHVVPEEQDVLQQSPQSEALLTPSPSGTHAVVHFCVVSSHVPVLHRLAVHVTVSPQLSFTVPAHCVPQAAARGSAVQHVVPEEQEVVQQSPQSDVLLTRSPPGTHDLHFFVTSSHVVAPVQRLAVQSTVLPQLSFTVPAQRVPQAVATLSETQQVVPDEHEVLQQSAQSAAALTSSLSATHVSQRWSVSSHVVLPVHRLAVQVTVSPQLSTAVPAHCLPQAFATESGTHASFASMGASTVTS
jgi:hypothetical protein